MEKLLINTDEYNGRYIAMISFEDSTIVGVGDTPEEALFDAKKKGYTDPVLIYVPEKDIVHIY